MGGLKPRPKKPPQLLFGSKNTYAPGRVKVEHWEYNYLMLPKDNYDDPSLSSYNRFGTEDIGARTTETRDMLAQVFGKSTPIYSGKSLVNFTSYPCTDTPSRNKLMAMVDLPQHHPDHGKMDYSTTHQDDFRNPNPCVLKPITMASPVFLMNRIVRSDTTQNHSSAPPPGIYMFNDTHTPIGHIRQLRLPRYQTFNPATGLQDFPTLKRPLDAQ